MTSLSSHKLTIAYEGSSFAGWQRQPNGVSIQELVEKALKTVLREEIALVGAARTDAGVHAMGQVAHFSTSAVVHARSLLYSCNALLPHEIRIMSVEAAPLDFHARYHAIGKIYHYRLWLDAVVDPFVRRLVWQVPRRIDLTMLEAALPLFVGKKNFLAFANSGSQGAAAKNPVRTLKRLDLVKEPGGVRLEFEGDGFLYKMVRNIVGTLMEVAGGKRSLQELESILTGQERTQAGSTAPACGLTLMKVIYPE